MTTHRTTLIFIFLIFISQIASFSCAQQINFGKVLETAMGTNGTLSSGEIGAGLKEALVQGVTKGTQSLSKENAYLFNPKIKIPFPPDVQRVESALRKVGLGGEVDKFVEALNHGAEQAAKEAKPIFINSIKQMTIDDAMSILKGEEDAATQYLSRTTNEELTEKFMPVVEKALAQTKATKHYTDLANTYNKIPLTKKVNPDLKSYATEMAIRGLFLVIAEEEAKIRKDPLARSTALLKKVFGNS